MIPLGVKVFLAGIPLTPVSRIAGAIIYVATSPDPATNGSAWLLPDDGPVFMVPKEEFKLGVYKMIDDRRNSLLKCVPAPCLIANPNIFLHIELRTGPGFVQLLTKC